MKKTFTPYEVWQIGCWSFAVGWLIAGAIFLL